MIPILQFDPSTLSILYDTQLLASSRSSREVGLALHYALDGNEDWLKCLVRQQSDEWTQTRCATVASAVWHEKRHFLDFILTNYGALRLRMFFNTYINARVFLQKAQQNGPLLMPLDRNLDQYRCEMMGVEIKDPEIHKLAKSIEATKKMLLDDRRPFQSRFGLMEVGGESILECIAYHVQLGKTHRVFGQDILRRVQRDNPSHELVSQKYQWAYAALLQAGLLEASKMGDQPLMMVRDEPIIPILYGALAGRYHGQEQTRSEATSSYLPAERFYSLMIELRDEAEEFAQLSVLAAWERVNEACSAVFGRTVIEEIDADFDHEARLIDRYRQSDMDDFVLEAYQDFHELRGKLIAILKDDPAIILDQGQWSDKFVNRTQPFVVAAAPSGIVGTPPDGFTRLSGYAHPDTNYDDVPDAQWWWTAMRDESALDAESPLLRLSNQQTWSHIASDFAPIAKLILDGNRMRSMVGPEIFSTKIRMERQTEVSLIVDPLSRYPVENMDIEQWYHLSGRERFRCQVTHRVVSAPQGRMLGPWEVRMRPAFLDALVDILKGDMRERMRLAIWRDWSPWLVCDEVAAIFDEARIDESALN